MRHAPRLKEDLKLKVYADNAATTMISQTAIDTMSICIKDIYGNPSSLHTTGQRAAEALACARHTVAVCLGARDSDIYFTSGGSESDNQAIRSAALYGKRKNKTHIISTKFEHHAVLHTLEKLEREGFEVTYLDVHEDGIISLSELESAIRDDTALVTVMYANNEIGTIEPIDEIGEICARHKVIFHTDAVQAVGHIPIDVKRSQIDMMSVSAHKFNGPKGIGVLYAKDRAVLSSLIEGGAQERGRRAGTENVPAIVSMAAALEEACGDMDETGARLSALRDRLIDGLLKIPHSILNGSRSLRLPGNVNICFEGIEGESLLLMLDMYGIEASSGSACTSGSLDPSHVLLAIGRPHDIAHGSLRLTLDRYNTADEIDYIIEKVPEVVAKLRDMSPVWDDLQKGRREYVIQ